MYRPALVTPPTIKPVTKAEAKAHCRVDYTDDDTLIEALIDAAVSHLDGWNGILGRCLCEQSWRQDFDDFYGCLRLPLFPVIDITSIKYQDQNNLEQTVDAANYSLQTDASGAFIRFTSGYSAPTIYENGPAVSVTYKAGYANTGDPATAANVPQALRQAMLLMIGHWYNNRESVVVGVSPSELPMAADALIGPYRRIKL